MVDEKKKAIWSKLGGIATVTMPSGKTANFDFSKLNKDVTSFYGAKQLLADSVASETTEADKLQGMRDWYKEASEKGLELTEGGRVHIIGAVRSNAGVGTALKAANSMIDLLIKKANGVKLTPEEDKSLTEMIALKNKKEGK